MTASEIIERLGGVTAVSQQLGVPLTTVSSWVRSGYVPSWRQTKLLELAAARNEPLSTADFLIRRRRKEAA
jgi:hypothetical protein